MLAKIDPKDIRYIKLGSGGLWEEECLQNNIIRMGFGTERPKRWRLCNSRDWKGLKRDFHDKGNSLREASRFAGEVRRFFEDDGTRLWITFSQGQLYWCFLNPKAHPAMHPDGVGVWRAITDGWQSIDLRGNPLTRLSPKLTKLIRYQGTSCSVRATTYVLRRINGETRSGVAGVNPPLPTVSDLAEPPDRQAVTTYRILRDTALARRVKALHKNECQVCGHTIVLPDGSRYSEGHHIRPLGEPHNGPDVMANIICVCPNHHAELDYGVRPLSLAELRTVSGHVIAEEYIRYHNEVIHGGVTAPAESSARRAGRA